MLFENNLVLLARHCDGRTNAQVKEHLRDHFKRIEHIKKNAPVSAQKAAGTAVEEFVRRMKVFQDDSTLNFNLIHQKTNYPGQFTTPLTKCVRLGSHISLGDLGNYIALIRKSFGVAFTIKSVDQRVAAVLNSGPNEMVGDAEALNDRIITLYSDPSSGPVLTPDGKANVA